MMPGLLDPIHVGDLYLPNRVVMAPLTRCRAVGGQRIPNMRSWPRITRNVPRPG